MKKLHLLTFFCLICLLSNGITAQAQTDKPYTEGSVWDVSFVQTKSGMGDMYLKNLSEGWVKIMRAAKDQGLIQDYKVISSEPAAKTDWDLMLMVEYKNYASLDGLSDKFEALQNKTFGSEETQHEAAVSRNDLRDLLGGKLGRELIFK